MPVTWFDGIVFTVEAALSASTGTYGAWDASLWDTATWGPDVVWTDISAYVRSIRIDRRFSREVQTWESGTASVVLTNTDGRFSPYNLSGPYVTAGVTAVRPWRPLRIRVTYSGTTWYLYTGYGLAWEESFSLGPTNAGDAIVTVPCADEFARLAAVDGLAQVSQGAGETSGKRVQRVLNAAGHTGTRAIDDGLVTVQATTLAANAVTELKLTNDSEGGGLFVDADGTVVFERAYALMENARSNTVQGLFGDSGGELPYTDIQVAYNGDLVKNIISYARVGGTAQTVADNTSRALYGDRRDTRTDLICETDAQTLNLANLQLQRLKDAELRVNSITVAPRADLVNLLPQAAGRRVRDLVQVRRRPPGGHTIDQKCHIAGVHHDINAEGGWATTWDLWSAAVYQTYASSRWDVGTWDNASWFF